MSAQKAAAEQLRAVEAQQVKIGTEISALHQEIVDLKAAVAGQPELIPELSEAIASVVARSQNLDEMNPDAVPPVDLPVE